MTDGGRTANEFEVDKLGTNARTRAEGDIETIRALGGIFVQAVARTRMPMAVTDPRLPGNPIVFANEAFLRLSGYSIEEVLGQKPHFMNGPGTEREDAKSFSDALFRSDDILVETVQYRKDGSRFGAAVFVSPMVEPEGEISAHFLSYLDITARVKAEEELRHRADELEDCAEQRLRALRRSEEQFRRIVESATDYAIFMLDADAKVADWLPGAEAVFGWTAKEIIGRPFDITFTAEDRGRGRARARDRDGRAGWHRARHTLAFAQGRHQGVHPRLDDRIAQ